MCCLLLYTISLYVCVTDCAFDVCLNSAVIDHSKIQKMKKIENLTAQWRKLMTHKTNIKLHETHPPSHTTQKKCVDVVVIAEYLFLVCQDVIC
jgi:hypothetical protein